MPYLFDNYKTIQYEDQTLINLINKPKISQAIKNLGVLYYPYVIQVGQRADNVAYSEYGDPTLDWLVYMSNDIIDPHYEWYLTEQQLTDLIIKKHGSVSAARNKILYKKSGTDLYSVDTATYDTTRSYTDVTAYDEEVRLNEERKHIQLVRREYIPIINKEIKKLFK